jgi:hypothetical protein
MVHLAGSLWEERFQVFKDDALKALKPGNLDFENRSHDRDPRELRREKGCKTLHLVLKPSFGISRK